MIDLMLGRMGLITGKILEVLTYMAILNLSQKVSPI